MSDQESADTRESLDRNDAPSRGVIDYFSNQAARFFAWLGTIAFVLGWAGVIYLAFFAAIARSRAPTTTSESK